VSGGAERRLHREVAHECRNSKHSKNPFKSFPRLLLFIGTFYIAAPYLFLRNKNFKMSLKSGSTLSTLAEAFTKTKLAAPIGTEV
jgi:hypothetical protein